MGPYTFRVTTDPAILEAAAGTEGRSVAGFSTLEACVIGVSDDPVRSHAFKADTLLHELLHCSLRVSGYDTTADEEEKVVLAASTNLLHCLRENPAVVAYLTHKGG